MSQEVAAIEAVRAKMYVTAVETSRYGKAESASSTKVRLGAIYGTEGENADFTSATPSGECWMQISAGRPAAAFFEPGAKYYVTFTRALD